MPKSVIYIPEPPPPITIIGSAKATTPPTETPNQNGLTVIVPVSTHIEGDVFVALVGWPKQGNGTIIKPAGWTLRGTLHSLMGIWTHIATDSEPTDYTWTTTGTSVQSRGGCMITLRNAKEIPIALSTANDIILAGTDFPINDVINEKCGSIYLGFATGLVDSPTELLVADSPLILQIGHSGDGDSPYAFPMETAIATELDVVVDNITGRSLSAPAGPPFFIQRATRAGIWGVKCP